MAELVEKAVAEALKCAVEWQDGAMRSVASLAVRYIIRDVLDAGVSSESVQIVAMRAVVHPLGIQAIVDALLKTSANRSYCDVHVKLPLKNISPRKTQRKLVWTRVEDPKDTLVTFEVVFFG